MSLVAAGSSTATAAATLVPTGDPERDYRRQVEALWEDERDRWGRPLVALPDGSGSEGYRRASSYGSPLEDPFRLDKWKLRQVAIGMMLRPALGVALAAVYPDLDSDNEGAAKDAKDEVDRIVEEAMRVAGAEEKANIGTALHKICERIDRGLDPGFIPPAYEQDIIAYVDMISAFEVLSIERIVVQDKYKVGGKLDRVVRLKRPMTVRRAKNRGGVHYPAIVLPAGTVVLGDQKTSQTMDYAGSKFALQCWCYANGVPYDPVAKVREDWGHEPPNKDWAVIFSTPSGQGKASLHWVNLADATAIMEQCHQAHETRNKHGRKLITHDGEDYAALADLALDLPELWALYERAVADNRWTKVLAKHFSKRRKALELEAAADGTLHVTAERVVPQLEAGA